MGDKDLQQAVIDELEWNPEVESAHIGVAASDGAVTLTGHVESYAQKTAAVRTAERVRGVLAVADELEIRLPSSSARDDSDIAEAIARSLKWHTSVPRDKVDAEVRNGWVTLRGEVDWSYQRDSAERVARDTMGVKGVSNLITLKTRPKPEKIERRIGDAIRRMANLDAKQIDVTATDGTIHLRGQVHSWYEKRLAEREAAAAAGVREVDNQITVVP